MQSITKPIPINPPSNSLKPSEILTAGAASVAAGAATAQLIEISRKNKIDSICRVSKNVHNGSISKKTGLVLLKNAKVDSTTIEALSNEWGSIKSQIFQPTNTKEQKGHGSLRGGGRSRVFSSTSDSMPKICVPTSSNVPDLQAKASLSSFNIALLVAGGFFTLTLSGLSFYRKRLYNLPFFKKIRELNKTELEKKIEYSNQNTKYILSTHTDWLEKIENQMNNVSTAQDIENIKDILSRHTNSLKKIEDQTNNN